MDQAKGLSSLLVMLLLYRAANALLCRSLFVPDEQWQSLEVAYKMVFNRGYLSWEWHKAIRGYTHPLIFAVLYKLLTSLGMDTPTIMAESPRLLQSVLAAVGDLYVYRVTKTLFDSTVAKYALLAHVISWFTFYSCTRTLSNSFESSITPVVLYYWLASLSTTGKHWTRNSLLYLTLSSISVIVRPTGVILFAPLFVYHLLLLTTRYNTVILVGVASGIGSCTLLWNLLIDRYFYGNWVFPPFNFLKFNVLEGQSAMFGTHPWHWYLTQGLPTIIATYIPFLLHGVWLVLNYGRGNHTHLPLYLGMWLVVSHSFLKHKEFRFVQPFIPLTSAYIGFSLKWLKDFKGSFKKPSFCSSKQLITIISIVLLLVNVPISAYFCLVHQRGGYAVMDLLRREHSAFIKDDSVILFLMPCHSTPQYSLFHTNATFLFLECTHKWDSSDHSFFEEKFYNDPVTWINDNIVHTPSPPPSYIIMYDVLYDQIQPVLKSHYQLTDRVFNTHFRDNERIGTDIVVLRTL